MNDKELADKVVALGVFRHWNINPARGYIIDDGLGGERVEINEATFVRDWRVAGALMEKVGRIEIRQEHDGTWSVDILWAKVSCTYNESLPRAIIEACVEAL